MTLTINELVILRQLERVPGSTTREVFDSLETSVFPIPIRTVYVALQRLWEYCAVEVSSESVHHNGMTMKHYVLSDADEQSLAELRAFFRDDSGG